MASAEGSQPSAAFGRELRVALRHLYDPGELRKSLLMKLLPVDPREGPGSLQRILVAAIEELKPQSQVSGQSSAWRIYQTLSSRYVQQFQQSEVATELGLSVRQMARQQRLALQVLAEHLWRRYDVQGQGDHPSPTAPAAGSGTAHPAGTLSREQELRWAGESLGGESIAIKEMVAALLATAAPLARAVDVRLDNAVPQDLPLVVVRPATVRQALLNLLTAAMRSVPGGEVSITAREVDGRISVLLRPSGSGPAPATSATEQQESVEMARQLLELAGGSLELGPGEGAHCPFTFRLVLPAVAQAPVLVIDDNADALLLFQHYLEASPYAFAGARDAQQALALAETLCPRAVVLDVMLPGVDGWELLGRLREHPTIRGVPIVVCTILPQEQLALALGAAAFLRKPVSRSQLFAALDRLAGPQSPESRR